MNDLRSILAAIGCCVTVLSAAAAAPPAARGGSELAPRTDAVAHCSWDRPGHNPFMGEVVPAVDRYADIPAEVRTRLKERIAARRYDEIVEIRRDSIRGRHDYRPEIRDMHFGVDRVCREVTRSAWTDAMRERGLVYCESGHCILVPTVCRNVSRIDRIRASGVAGESFEAPAAVVAPAPEAPAGPAPSDLAAAADPSAVGEPVLLAGGAPSFADGAAETSPPFAVPLWGGEGYGAGGGYGPGFGGGGGGPGGGSGGGGMGGGGTGGDGSPAFGGPVFGSRGGDGETGGGSGIGGIDGDPVIVGGGGSQGSTPVSPVPEPSTWAGLLVGLALVAAVNRGRQRRAGAPRCATQKRS